MVEYDLAAPFLFAPGGIRLIEIHPTRRCNLRCQHCYSESGPDEGDDLSLEDLNGFLREAARIGYNYVGISGGEPLLWGDLISFLRFAKQTGFSTAITTNGTLLTHDSALQLRDVADIVSVSVDGPPEVHGVIRNSPTAFGFMERGLKRLRKAGVSFTLTFTLTRYNAGHLSWLYNFADQMGAAGLHIHPLCGFGAAKTNLADAIPDSLEFKMSSYLLALLISQHSHEGPVVTMDAMKLSKIMNSPWALIRNGDLQIDREKFVDLVPSLVVESDGYIVPFIYGFPRCWSLGSIGKKHFTSVVKSWKSKYAMHLSKMIRKTLERLSVVNVEYVDLFGELMITSASYQSDS